MILPGDRKKVASLIMKRMKGSESYSIEKAPTNELGDETDYGMGYEAAADEIIVAIGKKDVHALKTALKSFIQMCMDEQEQTEEDEE